MTALDLREQLQLALGQQYTIERELGGGGMSRVFLAEETRFARRVVVKVLAPELVAQLSTERFEREIRLAAQLQQANIVPVLGAGDTGCGMPYYTMPFVEGESLRVRMQRGAIPVVEVVAILRDVARALAYAHARGIVHRDIKPENVLLSGGAAVVTDFGIAKALSAAKTPAPEGAFATIGTSLGTPAYMAPEQTVGDPVDHRADIYAWGVIAYELLAGEHPFAACTSLQQLLAAHIAEPPVDLGARVPPLPPRLTAIVMASLEKQPGWRPADAGALLVALDDPLLLEAPVPLGARTRTSQVGQPRITRSSTGGTITEDGAPPRWSTRRVATSAVLATLVVVGTAIGWQRVADDLRAWSVGGPMAVAGGGGRTNTTGADLTSASPDVAISTVAVLPFTNTGGGAEGEYFSDGLTDELSYALSRLPGVRLAGRTSSYAYKGKATRAQEIGRVLHVGAVVEGTVRRAGNRLRVTAQLTSAHDGMVLWSDSYQSESRDVFQVQDELTTAIASALAPRFRGTAAASAASESRGTTNADAYDFYLRGRYFWEHRNPTNLPRAIRYFTQAVAADSLFARAHAGLALAASVSSVYFPATISTDSAFARAERHVDRALALDSTVGEAYLARGTAYFHRMRFAEAEPAYQAGLLLAPGHSTGRMWHAENLSAFGQLDEGLAEVRRAVELEPLSPRIAEAYALRLVALRRFPEAVTVARRALEIDPNYARLHLVRGHAFLFGGEADSAVAAYETAERLDATFMSPALMMIAYEAAGDVASARRLRAVVGRLPATPNFDDERLLVALADGDMERALTIFERVAARRTELLWGGNPTCTPYLDLLKPEPRYQAAIGRLGLVVCPQITPWPARRGDERLPDGPVRATTASARR